MKPRIFLAFLFFGASLAAHADTVYTLQGTLATEPPDPVTGYQASGGNFSGIATLNGDGTAFNSLDVTITPGIGSPFSLSGVAGLNGTLFQDFFSPGIFELGIGFLVFGDGVVFDFPISSGSLTGFAGADLCSASLSCGPGAPASKYFFELPVLVESDPVASGSIELAVAATPEPSSFALLGTGLLGFAAMARRRFAGIRKTT